MKEKEKKKKKWETFVLLVNTAWKATSNLKREK